jgi:hypothetical protein
MSRYVVRRADNNSSVAEKLLCGLGCGPFRGRRIKARIASRERHDDIYQDLSGKRQADTCKVGWV